MTTDQTKQHTDRPSRFYETQADYNSETNNEYIPTARACRLKLAKVIGISSIQIQQAAAALADW